MKKILFILLFCSSAFSQKADSLFSPIYGICLKDNSIISNNMANCSVFNDRYIYKGQSVLVNALYRCEDDNLNYPEGHFFNISIDGESLYVEAKDLSVSDNDIYKMTSMSDLDRMDFTAKTLEISNRFGEQDKSKAFEILKKHASKGVTIVSSWIFGQYSTRGFAIKFYNPTKKTIKYIWITVRGYDAVMGVVTDPIKKKDRLEIKAIGPIEPYKFGEYFFENFWFTDIVENYKITNIKIQYMDGTYKYIENPKDVIMPKEYSFILDADE